MTACREVHYFAACSSFEAEPTGSDITFWPLCTLEYTPRCTLKRRIAANSKSSGMFDLGTHEIRGFHIAGYEIVSDVPEHGILEELHLSANAISNYLIVDVSI